MAADSTNVFSFGIISDTQYCDCDDGAPFDKQATRRYRQSLDIFHQAAAEYHKNQIQCCILLGDMLDGRCSKYKMQDLCLDRMLSVMRKYDQRWYIPFGNHDFYNFPREVLLNLIHEDIRLSNACNPLKLYYHFSPYPQIRFIVLDPFEISTFASTSSKHQLFAEDLLSSKNKNLTVPGSDWSDGLAVEDQKYVPYNGSLSDDQLTWLIDKLVESKTRDETCFVFTHVSINPDCVRPSGLVWNHEEILSAIHTHGGKVAAIIAGHDHNGGYAVDSKGIHHIVPPAPLECDLGEVSYGIIDVDINSSLFHLKWYGRKPVDSKYDWPTSMAIR
jgi:manganese-dependent ADP-ribose/CDP-alcohol diphosphatase